jgi:hypothetical protein
MPTIDRNTKEPLHAIIAKAMAVHEAEAQEACALLRSWTLPLPRVPGCDTLYRLAVAIGVGRSIDEAAAREYCYRWRLALQSRTFGVPHALGM